MTVTVYDAPNQPEDFDSDPLCIFLAGSIEMGRAEKWQDKVIDYLKSKFNDLSFDIFIYNPRRPDWDSTWNQSIDDANFTEQVSWELSYLQDADAVLFWFDPKSQSPISLLELGKVSAEPHDQLVAVYCPQSFWKKGNVDITCVLSEIPVFDKEKDFFDAIDQLIDVWHDASNLEKGNTH